jgi:hypothetical protein
MKKKKLFQRLFEKLDKKLEKKAKKKSCCSCNIKDSKKNG